MKEDNSHNLTLPEVLCYLQVFA